MTTDLIRFAWQFILLCSLQILVFNNIQLGGYLNPFPYVYLLLILPISIGRVSLLFVSFSLGLVIDVFSNTGGIHAAASTVIGVLSPSIFESPVASGRL